MSQTINRAEAGQAVTLETAGKLAEAMGVKRDELGRAYIRVRKGWGTE